VVGWWLSGLAVPDGWAGVGAQGGRSCMPAPMLRHPPHAAARVAAVTLALALVLALARSSEAADTCVCSGGQYSIDGADCLDNILCRTCQPCPSVPCCTASSHWARLASASPWAPRDGHAVVSAPLTRDGGSTSVFVLGGRLRTQSGNASLLNDVWETRDGRTWTAHTFDVIWSPRAFFGAVAVGYVYHFLCRWNAEEN
jgi:hypothetical protein